MRCVCVCEREPAREREGEPAARPPPPPVPDADAPLPPPFTLSWLRAACRPLTHAPLMRAALRPAPPSVRPVLRARPMAGKRAASGDPAQARPAAAASGGAAASSAQQAPSDNDALLAGITPAPLPPPLAAWVDALPGDVRHVLDTIAAAGGAAWPVGGCVRDVLSGRPPREVDVCTSLPPAAVAAAFPDAVPHRGTGDAYGTLSVRRGGTVLEVTTLRTDGTYSDGRRPDDVTFATRLADDLARRDFTVNAAAVDVGRRLLLDPHGGAADAAAGVLRCVGDPAVRLADDGLRVWRAYRFMDNGANGLRRVDPALAAALASPAVRAAAARVSRERLWEELSKMLTARNAAAVVAAMAADGVLGTAVPGCVHSTADSRGVRAQAHLLSAWRRFHDRARAHGMNVHSGSVARAVDGAGGGDGAASARPGSPPPPAPTPPAFLLALDLEATCDAPRSPSPQEVIEIGAVLLDGATCAPLAAFHTHVRPTIHPALAPFCVAFTGVTQADVDGAPTLGAALDALTAWLTEHGVRGGGAAAPHDLLPVTVGDWDLDTLLPRQAERLGLALPPWTRAWCDAQVLYREHYLRPRASLLSMLADLGLRHAGRPHAALDDAQSLASLLAAMTARGGAVAEVTRSVDAGVAAYAGDAPDLVVARLALLLAGATPDAAAAAARGLRLGRHEAKRVTRAVASLGRLPDAGDQAGMRLFRAAMGSQLTLQLLLEAALTEAEAEEGGGGGAASGSVAAQRVDAFVDAWRALPPLAAPASAAGCLLDGAALMAATGLKPGKQLGRLKEWLWRVQVERDLASADEVAALLDELPWRESEPDGWPRMEW